VPLPDVWEPTQELLQYVPKLSFEERDRRWDRLRKKMLMAGFDALVFLGNDVCWGMGMANMSYALRVDSHAGAQGLFPLVGEPVVWYAIPHMNRPMSMYECKPRWVSDFRTAGGLPAIADELRQRGLDRSKIGLVSFSSTVQTTATIFHGDMLAIERLLPNAVLLDANSLLQEMRLVKSEEEIELLRGAGKIARKVVDAMIETARPGVPEAAVYAEMIRTQIANGADPNIFNLFTSGPVEHPSDELWSLLHGKEQPVMPTMRPISEGDLVIAEWHTKYGGYRCHTEFTVYVGKVVPKELQRIWDVSIECLDASREALVAGRTLREAWTMIREPAKRAGLDWVEVGFHAMGTASTEFPTVVYEEGYGANQLNGDGIGDVVLEERMTFGNNIDLHDSAWKPDVGCMLSDFMVVRPGKAECLVDVPRELPAVLA